VPGYIHFVPTGRKKYAALGVAPAFFAAETAALPGKTCLTLSGPSSFYFPVDYKLVTLLKNFKHIFP
jgi:hypothetical protein